MATIAIVGAGMGGLSALNKLKQQHHQVHVFDKSRGSGGRLASKKVADVSWDMGAQFMRAHTQEFAQQLQHWQQQGWIERWSFDPWVIDAQGARPSADGVERYVGVSRMTALSRQLLQAADEFHASTRIVACQWQASGWWLQDEQQQSHGPYDALVLNLPPQQAQPLLDASPELQARCDVAMQPCWTLLLAFEQPLATPFDAAFVKQGPLGWIARNNSKPQRQPGETWVLQAQHGWSGQHLEHSKQHVTEALLQAFWSALQLAPQTPTEHWLHRWLYAISPQPLQRGALSDLPKRLTVCGDWCDRGAVEGAWLSGQQAANDLLTVLE
ncbi:NAD(P)/FAD-dependent oxidoreductase [Bacterioplanes sanyensis]|nr:FAD-dependent oxidoreductase [Bacterioplanes sanyensis]